jgi:uncharacterized protein
MGSLPPPPPPLPPPAPQLRALRWGLGDALLAFVLAVVAGYVASALAIALTGTKVLPDGSYPETAPILFAAVAGQYGVWFGWIVLASIRKGLGSLRADFGLVVDLVADWWMVPLGLAFEMVAAFALWPISHLVRRTPQEVVKELDTAHGVKLAILVVTAVAVAPVVEELFFRGLLLRSLQRRVSAPVAVALSALAFAAAHLLDPGAYVVVPALVALGMISGVLAVRTGNLSRSILLHVGFNLLAVLSVLRPR